MNQKLAKRIRKQLPKWNEAFYTESTHEKEKPHVRGYRDSKGKVVPMKVTTLKLSETCGKFLYKRAKKLYA